MDIGQVLVNAGGLLAARAAALSHFSQNQLVPGIRDTIATINEFKNDKLSPALDHAISSTPDILNDIGSKKLAPATDSIIVESTRLHDEKIKPAFTDAGNALSDFHEEKLMPALAKTGAALEEFGREKVMPAIDEAGKYAKEHPAETAVIVGSGLALAFPSLISGPILGIFGWGWRGVRAGSSAAALQSLYGDVAARGAFATAQSSAMGGYGAVVINGIVRVGAAVVGAVGFGEALGDVVHEKPEDGVVVVEVDTEHGEMKA